MVENIESVFRTLNIDFASECSDLPGLFDPCSRILRCFRSSAAMCDNADTGFLRKQGIELPCHHDRGYTHHKNPHHDQHSRILGIFLFPHMERNRLFPFIEIVKLRHLHHIERCAQQAG